ncbi:MAG: cellulase family glycosylhydrolase [Hyphomonadaceae bacterium]|nr:cellulase family glycosylhydrolase [Hyphomonadaceae bacterium]
MKRFRLEKPYGRWTRRAAITAVAALATVFPRALAQAPVAAHPLWPVEGPPVLRGAVIVQRRRRAEVDGETFGGGEAALPAYKPKDFQALAKAGANLVVMSFPELWTVAPPYARDAAMVEILLRQLDQAKAAGLYAVVALRSGPGRSDFIFHRDAAGAWFPGQLVVDTIWTDPAAQAAWAAMCVDAAKLLAGRTEVAGLNIMVEPDSNFGGVDRSATRLDTWDPRRYVQQVSPTSDWRRIAADCARQVRAAAPDLPVLISPPAYARPDFLPVMGAPPVSGTVWCVHDYEPRDYTHQSKDGKIALGEGDAGVFASRLAATKRGDAPIFLGEFGASRWAKDIDSYYGARIAMCEGEGATWAAFRWPTGDKDYEAKDDMFNLTIGPDGKARGAALPILREAWANNEARPGSALRGRN